MSVCRCPPNEQDYGACAVSVSKFLDLSVSTASRSSPRLRTISAAA